MPRRRRLRNTRWVQTAERLARRVIRTRLVIVFTVLFALGFVVGTIAGPGSRSLPYDELFGNMRVVTYRDAPADGEAHFAVELMACGRMFALYDVDAQRFRPPPRGRDYGRTITSTRYEPLRVRGYVDQGFWLEMPDPRQSIDGWKLDQVYRNTLAYVRPLSVLGAVLGTLSGYSVGYRVATWNGSLCRNAVQERVLGTPGLGRILTREAWRRVLLEPLVTADEQDAQRFTAVQSAQRIYNNFFRLALSDSDGFIPREAVRLRGLGQGETADAMLGFVDAVQRAARDVHLGAADFAAVERWASLLHREGHWASDATPPPGEDRVRYLGALTWYGLEPASPETRRVWVGPRVLVRTEGMDGFVTAEIPATPLGCPMTWNHWLRAEGARTPVEAVARGWLAERQEFSALVSIGRNVGRQLGGLW